MSVIVLALGILVTVGGLIALGFGIRINEFSLGHTLILTGTTALSCGLVVIGLAAAISKLTRIAEELELRPAPRAVRPADAPAEQAPRLAVPAPEPRPIAPRPMEPAAVEARVVEPRPAEPRAFEPRSNEPPPVEPRPAVDATLDVSASAIERLRSSIARPPKPDLVTDAEDVPLSPNGAPPPSAQNGAGHPPAVEDSAPDAPSAADTLKTKRLDFLFRSRASRPAPAEPFEPAWPKRSVRDLQNGPPVAPRPAGAERPMAGAPQVAEPRTVTEPVAPPRPEQPHTAAILKSGVVDGMAYTLYADGSIEAQLPHGTVRFGSIAELRAHIENNS